MKIISANEALGFLDLLTSKRKYFAMYSTLWDGVVVDSKLMVVPVDDHMVHRGDGVFEAIRITAGGIYLMRPHLERLMRSAEAISLKVPKSINELEAICHQLLQFLPTHLSAESKVLQGDVASLGGAAPSKLNEGMLRIFVSRGPGDFSPNPYTTVGAQVYIVLMGFSPLAEEKYQKGASVIISQVPVKHAPYATVKSCNYLPNVMMKKESIDAGADFAIAITSEGFIAEGPTENICIVSDANQLIAPKFDYTLRGTTLIRMLELAKKHQAELGIADVLVQDIHIDDFMRAKEVMMVGTTLSVLPVSKLVKNNPVNFGVGPVAKRLNQLVNLDMGI